MGGIPSAGVRRNGCWTLPPFFGGGVGPTTTISVLLSQIRFKIVINICGGGLNFQPIPAVIFA